MKKAHAATVGEPGICHLAGAGPGDLGLVTLRVKELVEKAEVIVFDYLCNPEILKWARPEAEIIYAGKKAGQHTLKQEEINALLVEKTRAGKQVLRLKGGDPFLFGRGGEEALALAEEGLHFDIVPGVTSAIAAPAYAGIPVTHREHTSQLTIFTGHEDPSKPESALDYQRLATQPGTKVMLMGVERIGPITEAFQAHGASPDLPVALIRWGTTGRQQTLRGTIGDIAKKVAEAGFSAPAVAVFGEVVGLREKLNWFEKRPLFGKRIAVTRTRQQAGGLIAALRALGADAFEMPTIRIEPPLDRLAFGELVQDSHQYDWLIFTSPEWSNERSSISFSRSTTMRGRSAVCGSQRSMPGYGGGCATWTWRSSFYRRNTWPKAIVAALKVGSVENGGASCSCARNKRAMFCPKS